MSLEPSHRGAAIHPSSRGLGPLGWTALLLVCGAIVFFVGKDFVKTIADGLAAGKVVRADPDVEIVGQDETAGTITFRSRKSGMTATASTADVRKGKISFTTTDKGFGLKVTGDDNESSVVKLTDRAGHVSVITNGGARRNLPAWVPNYPGSGSRSFSDVKDDRGLQGVLTVLTHDSASRVLGWYGAQLQSAGLKVQTTTFEARLGPGGAVEAKSSDGKRTVNVSVQTVVDGQSMANVSFRESR